eukprot:scaffold2774_cov87-Phaeocystis_antarctica.AAC.4
MPVTHGRYWRSNYSPHPSGGPGVRGSGQRGPRHVPRAHALVQERRAGRTSRRRRRLQQALQQPVDTHAAHLVAQSGGGRADAGEQPDATEVRQAEAIRARSSLGARRECVQRACDPGRLAGVERAAEGVAEVEGASLPPGADRLEPAGDGRRRRTAQPLQRVEGSIARGQRLPQRRPPDELAAERMHTGLEAARRARRTAPARRGRRAAQRTPRSGGARPAAVSAAAASPPARAKRRRPSRHRAEARASSRRTGGRRRRRAAALRAARRPPARAGAPCARSSPTHRAGPNSRTRSCPQRWWRPSSLPPSSRQCRRPVRPSTPGRAPRPAPGSRPPRSTTAGRPRASRDRSSQHRRVRTPPARPARPWPGAAPRLALPPAP